MSFFKSLALLVLLAVTSLAQAGEIKPFSQAAFDQLAREGKSVVLAVHASWCSTCRAQKPVQETLMKQPAYQGITMFIVDFDGDGDVLNSTLSD